LYQQYDKLVNSDFYAVRHELPIQDTAFFFSVINHRINRTLDFNQPFGGGPYEGYPSLLMEVTQDIRPAIDFDVVDEFQISDGILQKFQYNLIAWIGTTIARNSTLEQIMSFVNEGGVLAVYDLQLIQVFETNAFWWNDPTHLPDPNHFNAISIGKGWVFDAAGNINNFLPFCVYQFRMLPLQVAVGPLPPVPVIDGVYFSYYPEGILLFNSQDSVATKQIKIPSNTNRVNYPVMRPGFSAAVILQPYQLILFDGTNLPTSPPDDLNLFIIIIVVVLAVVAGLIGIYCWKKKSREVEGRVRLLN